MTEPHPHTNTLLHTARALAQAGCSVVPTRNDGTKAPAAFWKTHQHTPATPDQLQTWFASGQFDGLGVITGTVSGNLEMLELEGRATTLLPELAQLLDDNGYGDLWRRLNTGYFEVTPSGGLHWLYRVTDAPARRNTKLARRPAAGGGVEVLIETRGEGGFTVTAPSAGRTHPTGQAWRLAAGTPATIPGITGAERDALYAIASLLDQMPAAEPAEHTPGSTPDGERDGTRPGDDYNTRATWDDILVPHGWTKAKRFSRGYGWTRPGKSPGLGISATTGTSDDGADRLYVFTTSTVFETERPYTKFGAYTLLEHGGDYTAAAKALAAKGFGHRGEPPRPASLDDLIAPTPRTNGANALAPSIQVEKQDTRPQLTVVEPATYSETDDGNALRLIDTHHHTIRYCPQRGSWLTWDGHRWTWDEAGHVRELARATARNLPTDDKQAERHRRNSLSRRGIEAMVALASSDPRAVVHLDHLDARPYQLNTPAGILDLRTATLTPPDPAALHTRSTTVAPDLHAEPTQWLRFLADTFAGDQPLTTYVQRLLGLSLIGTVLEQILPFGFGAGANGKTTLIGAVQRIVGIGDGGYSISAPAEMLLATQQQGHPTEIARLAGARLVVTSELEDGQRFAEARVKQLTGRDTISGRFMRQDWFSFTPTHTLWLLANHQPTVRAGGPAFWRRLRLLPFLHTVPPEARIADLEDRLVHDEGPAILGWIAQGAADYLTHGLAEPASVRAATDAYATDQDTVGRFVEECCQTGDLNAQHLRVKVAALRSAYETWCRTEGETPVSAKALTLELRSRFGVLSERDMSTRYYAGIRLDDLSSDASSDPSSDPSATDRWWSR